MNTRWISTALKGAGIGAGVLGTLFGATAAGLWWRLFRQPLPKTEGELTVAGIEGPVEIARDRWGMPRVRAKSTHDLWYGLGFCHGQDRLWQCDLYRRVAAGRLAEMAGPDGVELDRFFLTLGIRRAALAEEAALGPELRAAMEAFSAGINAAASAASAPPAEFQITQTEFAPWRPADTLSLTKLFAFGMSTNWERELLRADLVRHLGPEKAAILDHTYPKGNPVVTRPGQGFSGDGLALAEQIDRVRAQIGLPAGATGSNNWAINAERSATGGALIAGDPHLPSSMPGFIYHASLELGDRYARGGTMPGVPTIFFGQNPDVCWTFTNVMADVQDLFVEKISGDTYEFEGAQRPLEVVEEQINVRGSASLPHRVRYTHHGPIVNEHLGADTGQPLALSWTAMSHPGVSLAHFDVLSPTSGPELVELLEPVSMPVVSLVWADSGGSIGFKVIGRLPRRRGGCPDLPKPGWTGEFEWDGDVPYAEQPEITDPDEGFLVTANNMVAEPNDESWPHVSSDYLDGYRAQRIEQMIRATPEHDLDSFQRMQTDLRSIPGLEVARRLATIAPAGQRERRAVERLRSWDGEMGPDSVAATIYQAFVLRLGKDFARAAIGDRDLAERYLDRADNGFLSHVTSPWRWLSHLLALWAEADDSLINRPWSELVASALRGSLDDLEARYGPDPAAWRWGRIHELHFPHALGDQNPLFGFVFNRGLSVGGSQETVTQVAFDPNDPFGAIWAPAWRMVADPSSPQRSRWQSFTGQSGHAQSRHYDDLQPRWLAGEMQLMDGEGPWRVLSLTPGAAGPATTA